MPHGRGGGMGGHGHRMSPSHGPKGRGGMGRHHFDATSSGAQTFRRGRILNFLDRLFVKKETLENQLKEEKYQDLKPMITGELKAVEAIINEYIQEFDLVEFYNNNNSSE